MKWPYIEDDHMEIGETGWRPMGEGMFVNINTGHVIDENGNEFDAEGNMIEKKDSKWT